MSKFIIPLKRPDWLKTRARLTPAYYQTAAAVKQSGLNTVCEEAACPNIGECWEEKHATVMILGRVCTRACAFCNVATGKPDPVDESEPWRVAKMVAELGLKHVVITSVTRDDLPDGGALHFAKTIYAIRDACPQTSIEILTPDFLGKPMECVAQAKPDVFGHNVETVPRLYSRVRFKARYFQSLYLLKSIKLFNQDIFTKSGIMLGLGESLDEVFQVLNDLRSAEVDFLTIGQYMQPTPNHHPVVSYAPPEDYKKLEELGYRLGFSHVMAAPLARSSYKAKQALEQCSSKGKFNETIHMAAACADCL